MELKSLSTQADKDSSRTQTLLDNNIIHHGNAKDAHIEDVEEVAVVTTVADPNIIITTARAPGVADTMVAVAVDAVAVDFVDTADNQVRHTVNIKTNKKGVADKPGAKAPEIRTHAKRAVKYAKHISKQNLKHIMRQQLQALTNSNSYKKYAEISSDSHSETHN